MEPHLMLGTTSATWLPSSVSAWGPTKVEGVGTLQGGAAQPGSTHNPFWAPLD